MFLHNSGKNEQLFCFLKDFKVKGSAKQGKNSQEPYGMKWQTGHGILSAHYAWCLLRSFE